MFVDPGRAPRAASKARAGDKQRGEAAARGRGGGKSYRIAETRTRRLDRERDERFDDADVLQRASLIVMYVRTAPQRRFTSPLYLSQSLSALVYALPL